jgi:hypothetical protein
VFGGTSASSPIIASVFALARNTGTSNSAYYPAAYLWQAKSGLNDVTSGSNGSFSTTVWCHAGSGWDGPTGLGTRRDRGVLTRAGLSGPSWTGQARHRQRLSVLHGRVALFRGSIARRQRG